MGYKTLVSMNIAIVGHGRYAEALAKGLAEAGHDIFIATKTDQERIGEDLLLLYDNICPATPEYAGAVADVVIIATPHEHVREMAYLLDDVRAKVIIDLTSMNFTRYGANINTWAAIKAITGSAHVVKCYNRTGYEHLVNGDIRMRGDMLLAGHSKKAKALASLLAKDLGFEDCFDYGGDEVIAELDVMSVAWQSSSISEKLTNSIAYKLIRR